MGKKKALRRAIEEAEAKPFTPPPPLDHPLPDPDDGRLVLIGVYVTSADRWRLRKLGLLLDNTSLQRLGHRAWNALLASHGQPGLTPVLQGSRSNRSDKQ